MQRIVLIDSGPLGEIIHPKVRNNQDIKGWISFLKENDIVTRVAEICDYELRRQLNLKGFDKSLNRLNSFRRRNQVILIESEHLIEASHLWAWCRQQGMPTTDDNSLDGDVILVAQAIAQKYRFQEIIIVTTNPKDICKFESFGVKTWDWKQALNDWKYGEINYYNEIRKI